ncbi:MAG: YebC/PmpR family DNA-binding transcriptional regulator [Deltaproteobacteria bacterium]|nr:YebC/PmpR family DNA-binding transcriptional regulator [Deltaproteobacteria bacterium]
MSGHSKWSTIKHKKGAADAKRGKVFTKLIKEITTSARIGGGDASGNARLRKAIDLAKAANMPADNVERAIKKGTGELEGVIYEEITYEGYGPGGVAVIVEVMTDNRNRTVSDVRHMFTKFAGGLGETGCASRMFDSVGLIVVDKSTTSEEQLMEVAVEVGAKDIREEDDRFEILTPVSAFDLVHKAVKDAGVKVLSAELTRIPQNTVPLEGKTAETMLKLFTQLEDHDDVQNVYANFDIPDDVLENFSS